jgi:regulator of protease activity HflC (stomatin/prohibitin superfamily)
MCPFCKQSIELKNFCSECGKEIGKVLGASGGKEGVWDRGVDDFAVNMSSKKVEWHLTDNLVIRHGTRALVFENGNLVEEVTSGRYSTQQEGMISRLFKKPKAFDVMLADAGDVPLHFTFSQIKSRDGMFVDIDMDLVVKLDQPSVFFLNVIKERKSYRLFELRQLMFKALLGAVKNGIAQYSIDDLADAARIKAEIASRIDAALRETLRRTGLEIAEVRAWEVSHEKLDALEKQAADHRVEAAGDPNRNCREKGDRRGKPGCG